MSKELLSMNVCPYCKKIRGNTKIEFFNHMVKCETMDHRDSPITTTWYTVEELKKYAKGVSIILLILFSINAAGNISKFAEPSKVEFGEFVMPETSEAAFLLLIDVLGLNAGIIAVTGIFISITLFLLFRFADLNSISRYFIFTISVIVFIIAIL